MCVDFEMQLGNINVKGSACSIYLPSINVTILFPRGNKHLWIFVFLTQTLRCSSTNNGNNKEEPAQGCRTNFMCNTKAFRSGQLWKPYQSKELVTGPPSHQEDAYIEKCSDRFPFNLRNYQRNAFTDHHKRLFASSSVEINLDITKVLILFY